MRQTVRKNPAECTGCGACVSICPKQAIVNLFCGVTILSLPPFLADFMLRHVGRSLLTMLLWSYGMFPCWKVENLTAQTKHCLWLKNLFAG